MSKCRFTNDYTVYSSTTTLPIAFGTLNECARALGVTKSSFASMASRRNHPKKIDPRYVIFKEGVDNLDSEEHQNQLRVIHKVSCEVS